MVVIPIVLALAAVACDASLQPVTLALQQNDLSKASALLSSVPADCSQSSSFYALTGITAELSGKPDEAESAFAKAISLDPQSPRLYEQLGAAYLRNKKPAAAAIQLEQAVALDPANSTVKKYLIGAYVETGSWQKAAALFDQLGGSSLAGNDPILLLWFAQTLLETKQWSRVDNELPEPAPGTPSPLLFSLGTLLAKHGMYDKAIDYLRAIPAGEADDAVDFNLGLAYSHLLAYEEARRHYFLAIDKHPGHPDAYFRIGLDFAASGDSRKALPWLFRAHRLASSRPDISYALVEQLIQQHYLDTARDVLGVSLQANPKDFMLQVAEADLQLSENNLDAAQGRYRQLLTSQPSFAPALVGLARTSIAKGNDHAAQSSLLAALARDPDDPSANGELGLLEAREENWTSAVTHLSAAWKRDRSNVTVALPLARAYRHLDRPADALQILTSARSLLADSSAFHIELAQTYTQLHQPLEAEAERKTVNQIQASLHDGLHFDSPKVYVP